MIWPALAGLGFGLFIGFYLGQRGGVGFVKQQLQLAGEAAEKMAQILIAPYRNTQVVEAPPQESEEAFDDMTGDQDRLPEWWDAGAKEEAVG